MDRRLVLAVPALLLLFGCAGSSKLSQKSEEKLASGDAQRAWQLATRALDKEPGNPRAQAAATAAGTSIVQEYQRRIRALAELDSMQAAEEVLELSQFRLDAARYATLPVGPGWPREEAALRRYAARVHYEAGVQAADSGRPKRACAEFAEAGRYMDHYRDLSSREDQAQSDAITRVAVVPFRASSKDPALGVQVAQAWRGDLAQNLAPPATQFTRILGDDAIENAMTVSELQGVTREDALRLGRKTGAQRVVWGSVGGVKSKTRVNVFKDTVARRVVVKNRDGSQTVTWIDVPIQVIARVRDVNAGMDYEVIETRNGATLSRRHVDRSTSARVVWTFDQFEGDPSSYALVSETVATANPQRAKQVQARWKSVCGEGTTLAQVVRARREAGSSGRYSRSTLPRFAAGAAFVFLEDLPPAEDLALAALSQGYGPLRSDLVRMDAVDDVDLGGAASGAAVR
jgi:hypothetical protein